MNVDDVLNFCQNYFGQDWDDTGHKNEVNEMLESTIPRSNRELEPFPLPLYEANESVETSPPDLELKPLPETPTYMFLDIDKRIGSCRPAVKFKKPPQIYFKKKKTGGISFNITAPLTHVDEKLCYQILHEYKIHNAESGRRPSSGRVKRVEARLGSRRAGGGLARVARSGQSPNSGRAQSPKAWLETHGAHKVLTQVSRSG
ncbi:hypothetical protein POM88_011069 [Heracleum sosnowskyi]|uniref:Uncharacterized protein n=1 Tax=Heracleum sosnowskyi TaxID=360622 RepID=A0AAD8N240_9APIA|nr:hypothetical protein POM88_011069 [Heracleum sosnowskyi]